MLLASQRQAELLLSTTPPEAEEHKIAEAELAVLHGTHELLFGAVQLAPPPARQQPGTATSPGAARPSDSDGRDRDQPADGG